MIFFSVGFSADGSWASSGRETRRGSDHSREDRSADGIVARTEDDGM